MVIFYSPSSLRLNQHGPQNPGHRIIPLSGAKSDFLDGEARRQCITRPNCRRNRSPGRRNQLSLYCRDVNFHVIRRNDMRHRRHRNRQDSVLTTHRPGSLRELRHKDLRDIQIVETDCRRNDIHDGIDRADLMEMYLIHKYTVCLCLRLRKNAKDICRSFFRAIRHLRLRNNMQDFLQAAVHVMALAVMSMVVMGGFTSVVVSATMSLPMHVRIALMAFVMPVQVLHIVVVVLVRRVQFHIEITGIQPRFFYSFYLNLKSAHRKARKHLLQYILICPQIQERRRKHIPADSRFTLQI